MIKREFGKFLVLCCAFYMFLLVACLLEGALPLYTLLPLMAAGVLFGYVVTRFLVLSPSKPCAVPEQAAAPAAASVPAARAARRRTARQLHVVSGRVASGRGAA